MSDAKALSDLEAGLEALRIQFDRYFLGLEKRPPHADRSHYQRKLRRYDPGKDAVTRFKWQNLTQRLTTYNIMWNRVLRQIEEGTYIRDVKKANMRQKWREDDHGDGRIVSATRSAEAKRQAGVSEVGTGQLPQQHEARVAPLGGGHRSAAAAT